MKLTRRDFLRWASLSAVGAVACNVFTERELEIQSPPQLPEDLVSGEDNWYATLCGQCPEGEGILVRVFQGRAKKVQGNPLYPTNQGKQSVRCDGGLQALYHPDRVEGPMARVGPRGSGQYVSVSWDDAVNQLAQELRRHKGSPNSLLTVTEPLRGHLGSVAKRFTDAYGGRYMTFQAMENAVLRKAIKDVFDQDVLPHFDIQNAQFLLSFGADFLSTGVSPTQYAREYGLFRQGEGSQRGYFVHADPRFSMTAASADEWIPIRPGTEGILALSIAYTIMKNAEQWGIDPTVVNAMTGGAGLEALSAFDPDSVAGGEGLLSIGMPGRLRGQTPSQVVHRIAQQFATSRRSLAIGGGEAAAHANGLFNLKAIFALNYLVDSVNKEGGIIFNPGPLIEGMQDAPAPSTLAEWQEVADQLRSGEIKALLLHGANPVHGLPADVGFWHALNGKQDPQDLFLVSFSSFLDETSEMADLILPDRTPMEDWGDDVPEPGPGYQVVGIRQPVVNPLPGLDPRSFGDLLLTLAQDLGMEQALPYTTFQDVLREGAQALYDLNRGSISQANAADFEGFWHQLLQRGGWWDSAGRSSAAVLQPPDLATLAQRPAEEQAPTFTSQPDGQGDQAYYLIPFASNSLLEGQGAHLPWLQAAPDPVTTVAWQTWLEINTVDAKREGLKLGDLVKVTIAGGSGDRQATAVTYPHPAIPPGVVAMPVGQGHTSKLQYAEGRGTNVLSLLAPVLEKETKAFAWAASRVRLEREGTQVRVTKFEANAAAFQEPHERTVRVVRE